MDAQSAIYIPGAHDHYAVSGNNRLQVPATQGYTIFSLVPYILVRYLEFVRGYLVRVVIEAHAWLVNSGSP